MAEVPGVLICGGISLFVLIVLFAMCWDTVEPTEWGLNYNSLSKTIDNKKIYDGGRYFIFLFHRFVTFPSTLQTIEFSSSRAAQSQPLRTRTAEGLALGLHIAFQYQLIKDELPQLYAMSNKDYETTFIRIARDVILQAAGTYEAPAYWLKRNQIGLEMMEQLDKELRKAHATCKYLQLLTIELPNTYEDSIVDTQVEVQKKRMKQYEQTAELIRQEINILRSKNDQEINVINASAYAEAYQIRQKAVAEALNNMIGAETKAYQEVQTETDLKGEDLNKYIFYLSMMGQKNAKLLVGVQNGIVNLNNQRGQQTLNPGA